ncbi:MAG: alpha/beta hydrolase [Sulfuritalea sp.]|nr:alpha/beta hydrolase [Sulfuritalea sp.]MCF8199049.1 alpha/beta hydrolase [Sulfuritalea sp.]
MKPFSIALRKLALLFAVILLPTGAMAEAPKIGIVIMHGKGGSPTRHVSNLASALEGKGYLVANLDMPWSGKREYDVDVAAAEAQIETALSELRGKGAQKVFVAGHSQGGAFALHFAGKHIVDGVICIAPGGDVSNKLFREKLGDTVERARQLVGEGKGNEKTELSDYEGSKGMSSVSTTPAIYLSWFDPDGAMNMRRAARAANPKLPILWMVAKRDYPGLRKVNIPMFDTLPKNPRTQRVEPDSDHLGAPAAALDDVLRWTSELAASGDR